MTRFLAANHLYRFLWVSHGQKVQSLPLPPASCQVYPKIVDADIADDAATGSQRKLLGPLPFHCLCGGTGCKPPSPQYCDVTTCYSEVEDVRWCQKGCWIAQCSKTVAHKSLFAFGGWHGSGCPRGVTKVSGLIWLEWWRGKIDIQWPYYFERYQHFDIWPGEAKDELRFCLFVFWIQDVERAWYIWEKSIFRDLGDLGLNILNGNCTAGFAASERACSDNGPGRQQACASVAGRENHENLECSSFIVLLFLFSFATANVFVPSPFPSFWSGVAQDLRRVFECSKNGKLGR